MPAIDAKRTQRKFNFFNLCWQLQTNLYILKIERQYTNPKKNQKVRCQQSMKTVSSLFDVWNSSRFNPYTVIGDIFQTFPNPNFQFFLKIKRVMKIVTRQKLFTGKSALQIFSVSN